jgi:hypothetical protein
MCLRTWRSHCVDDLLIIHHQQVPLPPAKSLCPIMPPSGGVGIRVPQIWWTFLSIIISKSTQARLQYRPCRYPWRPRIATKRAQIVRVEDARDDAMYLLGDDM